MFRTKQHLEIIVHNLIKQIYYLNSLMAHEYFCDSLLKLKSESKLNFSTRNIYFIESRHEL